jgi:hypothetical protein
MPTHIHGTECQAALCNPAAKDTSTSNRASDGISGVGDVERLHGRFAEALCAVPGQVLQGQKGAIEDKDHVESAVTDDDVVGLLDHPLERTTC